MQAHIFSLHADPQPVVWIKGAALRVKNKVELASNNSIYR